MAPLQDKVICVTGAARGIGLATAKVLASQGATLALADADGEGVKAAIASLPGCGHVAAGIDIRSCNQVDGWIQNTVQHFGRLDGAANVAGVAGESQKITEATDDNYDFVMDVNARGVFLCMRAQLRNMKEGGSIVNVASVAGQHGSKGAFAYCASKHAVIGLTRCAAKDMAPERIRVNAVAPGIVATPLVEMLEERYGRKLGTEKQAFDRQGDPTEVANVIAFLLSEQASFVTGAVYNADGGWMS